MDIRTLSPDYAVSPQISATDIPAVLEAGFRTIICNRPDAEIPPSHQAMAMRAAAEAAGLSFVENPVTHQGLTPEVVDAQGQAIAASDGPTLAYCASGTRATIVWALSQAGKQEADSLIAAAADAGYDISGLRPHLSRSN